MDPLPLFRRKKDRVQQCEPYCAHRSMHPKLVAALAACRRQLWAPGEVRIVCVIGPSGVGKSCLFELLADDIRATSGHDRTLPDHIPLISDVALAPVYGKFGWKDFFTSLCVNASEPLLDHKVNYEPPPDGWPRYGHKETLAMLRSFIAIVNHRKPWAVLIDEAHHLAVGAHDTVAKLQVECVKSMARSSDTIFFLFGTYELLRLLKTSEQVARSSEVIRLDHYDESASENLDFRRAVLELKDHLPVRADLTPEDVKFLFARSAGCVGNVRNALLRAAELAIATGQMSVTRELLQEGALKSGPAQVLAKEAAKSREELDKYLGDAEVAPNPPPEPHPTPAPKRRRGRPGERKPGRDQIPERMRKAA